LVDLGDGERIMNIKNKLTALTERFNKESIKLNSFIFNDTADVNTFLKPFKRDIFFDFL